MLNEIDVLAFGAHPDDVEIGMAGAIAKWTAAGKKVVICDLTKAELSSNGTVEIREKEAANAAKVLGVSERLNLGLPDRGLLLNEESIRLITKVIRTFKPKIIFAPYFEDRHPDHGHCAKLVEEAFFSAGIRKYDAHTDPAHKAKNLFFYFINSRAQPDFSIDVSKYMDKKLASLYAYESQFTLGANGIKTPLTEGYIEGVKARERLFGAEVGVAFAEGFKMQRPILLNDDLFGGSL